MAGMSASGRIRTGLINTASKIYYAPLRGYEYLSHKINQHISQPLQNLGERLAFQNTAPAGVPRGLASHIHFSENSRDRGEFPQKVIINQTAPVPSPASFKAGVENLLNSYFESGYAHHNAKDGLEKAKQDFDKTKFWTKWSSLISVATAAVGTAVFPFIGAIGFSLSTPLIAAFVIAAVEYFALATGIQYLIFRLGAKRRAGQDLAQKQNEYNEKLETFQSYRNDVQKLYQHETQREALAIELYSLWTSGEEEKQNRCKHIFYHLFTAEQQTGLNKLMQTYQSQAAAGQKPESGKPLDDDLKKYVVSPLTHVKRGPSSPGRIITQIEESPRGAEALAPMELLKIGRILEHTYEETEEGLNLAQQDLMDLREARKRSDVLPEDTAREIDIKLSQLNTQIENLRKTLQVKFLEGMYANYEVLNPIGRGGMGIVVRARNTSNNANVAIKYMPLSRIVEQSKNIAKGNLAKAKRSVMSYLWRFYNEYRLGQQLDHPNFCKALDTNIRRIKGVNIERFTEFFNLEAEEAEFTRREKQTTNSEEKTRFQNKIKSIQERKEDILRNVDLEMIARERVFLATEFIPSSPGSDVAGQTLDKYFRGKMDLEDVREYLLPVMEALAYAHEQGVYIRDLKPSNLVVTETETGPIVKIIDLGIAKATEEGEADVTTLGEIPGSPLYMPFVAYYLEAKRDRKKNALIDIYGMGAILYEKLTGKNPLRSLSDAAIKVHLFSKPIEFDFSEVPAEVRPMIEKMLVRDPAQNYPSMKAASEALAEAIAKAVKVTRKGASDIEELGTSAIVGVATGEGPDADATKAGIPKAKAAAVTDETSLARSTVLPKTGPEGIGREFLRGSREEIESDLEKIFDGEAQIDYKDSAFRKSLAARVTEIMMEHSDLSPLALDVLDMLSKYKD